MTTGGTEEAITINMEVLGDRLEKHSEEIKTLEAAIHRYDHEANELRPGVVRYNEILRDRKELRRELAGKHKQLKVMAEFLQGTTLFDARFPLFNQPITQKESA
jgi:predicted RNase H-like nuclease (RuvC/YqgF family)